MKNYTVIENDVRMRDIATWAEAAGLTALRLAIFTADAFHASIDDYEDYLAHGRTAERQYEHQRRFVADRRIFFMSKGDAAASDSRERGGLRAELGVASDRCSCTAGGVARVQLDVRNVGSSRWLPCRRAVGPGTRRHTSLRRRQIAPGPRSRGIPIASNGVGIAPGDRFTIDLDIPGPESIGEYILEIDLVAEAVCWFSTTGTAPAIVHLSVG